METLSTPRGMENMEKDYSLKETIRPSNTRGEVLSGLDLMDVNLDRLSAALSDLQDKIQGILMPDESIKEATMDSPDSRTDIGGAINSLNLHINKAVRAVAVLTDRVDL